MQRQIDIEKQNEGAVLSPETDLICKYQNRQRKKEIETMRERKRQIDIEKQNERAALSPETDLKANTRTDKEKKKKKQGGRDRDRFGGRQI